MADVLNDIADAIAARDKVTADQADRLVGLERDLHDAEAVIVRLEQELADATRPPADNLLLPDVGKLWLGVSNPSGGYTSFKSVTGREPHIWHEYSTSGAGFATDLNACPAHMIPLINCKPLGSMGAAAYRAIIAGDADLELEKIAAAIKANGRPLFLAWLHEPENDDKTGASDADYAQAFRYCVEYVRARGATFVSVWNMMGYMPKWGARYDTLYPGDDVVDWVGVDQYSINTRTDTFTALIGEFYAWAKPKAKPIMLCEWGIEYGVVATVAPRMLTADSVTASMAAMPLIKAHVYWNQSLGAGGNYLISHMPDQFRRYANLEVFT